MVKMLRDMVLMEIIEEERATKSGILLTTASDNLTQTAIVLAVGEGVYEDGKMIETTVKVGDRVLISDRATPNIQLPELGSGNFHIARELEIFGILREAQE